MHSCVGAALGAAMRPNRGRHGAARVPGGIAEKGRRRFRNRAVVAPFNVVWRNHSIPCLHKKRSSTPATDSPASVSMLLARRLCGCETDLRRPLSMLGSLVTGGAEISAEQKGAFILQASTPSTAQEGERPVCSLTTGLARRRTQTLCTTKH